MGRPKAKIDWRQVDQYLMAQCQGTEIAAAIGLHPNILYQACKRDHKIGFSEYMQIKRAKGVTLAKARYYQQAFIDPDSGQQATRQIFWLKNHAEMSDKMESKVKLSGGLQIVEIPCNKTNPGTIPDIPRPWEALLNEPTATGPQVQTDGAANS